MVKPEVISEFERLGGKLVGGNPGLTEQKQ